MLTSIADITNFIASCLIIASFLGIIKFKIGREQ